MSKTGNLRLPAYLGHIQEAIQRIYSYVEDMSEAAFLEDAKTQDAVIRNFEIIGEPCRNVELHHPEFAAEHPEVPWGFAYEMRNAGAPVEPEVAKTHNGLISAFSLHLVKAGRVSVPLGKTAAIAFASPLSM